MLSSLNDQLANAVNLNRIHLNLRSPVALRTQETNSDSHDHRDSRCNLGRNTNPSLLEPPHTEDRNGSGDTGRRKLRIHIHRITL